MADEANRQEPDRKRQFDALEQCARRQPARLALEGLALTCPEQAVTHAAAARADEALRPAALFQPGLALAVAAKLPDKVGH